MVNEEVTNFLSYLNLQKRVSPLTTQSYAFDIGQFFTYVEQDTGEIPVLEDIQHDHIRNFMSSLIEEGFSPVSVNHKLSALKSFFRYLVKTEVLPANPAEKVTGLKMPKKLPVFVDEEPMNRVFSTVAFGNDFEGTRDKLIIDLLYQTGIRRAELVGLKEGDADLFNMQIKVMGKRSKERLVPFDVNLKRSLENYLQVKREQQLMNPYLLVTKKDAPLNHSLLSRVVKSILAEVTTSRKKSPHVLRHTFATHILNNGADINAVKELLGHASLAATQIYTHNSIDKLKKMYNQAHPRSGN
jgi:integrase/recombinase XerC